MRYKIQFINLRHNYYQLPQQYTDKNNNNHTASTKCQYQIAKTKPK